MTKKIKAKIICGIWYVSLALIWGVVVLLLVEFGALFCQIYIEHTNPFITALRNGTPVSANTNVVIVKKEDSYYPEKAGGWNYREPLSNDDVPIQDFLESGLQVVSASATGKDERRHRFMGFSDKAKEVYTALNAEFVLAFDANHSIREKYGAYTNLFEGFQGVATRSVMRWNGDWNKILTGIQEANRQGMPQEVQVVLPAMQMIMLPVSVYCFPFDNNTNRSYVFFEMYPESSRNLLQALASGDSRWDIPFYRYKEIHEEKFQTNSMGFRAKEVVIPKPSNVFRILCLGGSTTEEGADNESTYPALLEARLQENFPDKSIEVINAGTSGISSDWHLLRIPEYLSVEPNLVILHLGVNDIWRQYNSQWVFNLIGNASYGFRLFTRCLNKNSQSIYFSNQIRYTNICLTLITRVLQEKGVAVAFASIAAPDLDITTRQELEFYTFQADNIWKLPLFSLYRYHQEITQSNATLKKISREQHAFYIPVAERLSGETGANIFTDFCHMTQRGIEVKADIIYDCIRNVLENYYQGKYAGDMDRE